MKKFKQIPKFKTEDAERKFWAKHSSVDYIDWSKAEKTIFPNLRLTTESISLRLPIILLSKIKVLANEKDVPYQSLMKMFLSERVKTESPLHLSV